MDHLKHRFLDIIQVVFWNGEEEKVIQSALRALEMSLSRQHASRIFEVSRGKRRVRRAWRPIENIAFSTSTMTHFGQKISAMGELLTSLLWPACPALPSPTLHCPALPCPACPTLPCPALLCPALLARSACSACAELQCLPGLNVCPALPA